MHAGPRFQEERLRLIERIEGEHFWFVARRRLVLHLLRSLDVTDRAADRAPLIVDIGAGTGSLVAELRRCGYRAVGFDLYGSASEDGPVGRALASHLPVADGSVDVVLALDVLEHVDDVTVTAELHRILRRGGAVVVTVPAHPWLWSRRDVDAGHLRRYRRAELGRVLGGAGFDLDLLAYHQFALFPVLVLSRLLGRRGSSLRDAEDRPPARLNGVLRRLGLAEVRAFEAGARWPTGSSLVARGRRP